MLFKTSDWRISGSAGESATFGTPTLKVQVGGARLKLPVENARTKEKATLVGYGAGAAAGASMETPLTDWVNVSISTADMPSTGIGNIFRRESTPDAPYKVDDLTGLLTVISGGGSAAAVGTQGSIVIWQKYAVQECYESGWKCNWFSTVSDSMLLVNPSTIPLAVLKSIHAIGIMTGIEATSDIAGVGVNAFTYYMTV